MGDWLILFSVSFGIFGGGLGALMMVLIQKNAKHSRWAILFLPLGVVGGVAVGMAVAALKKPIYDDTIKPILEKGKINTQLSIGAATVNARNPQMVDDVTRLDEVIPGDRKMQYIYTLVDIVKADLDLAEFERLMRPKIVALLCTKEDMAFFLENDVLLQYTYRDGAGLEVATIEVRSSDCQ